MKKLAKKYFNQQVLKELMQIVNTIECTRILIYNCRKQLSDINQELKQYKNMLILKIQDAIGQDGRVLYSNQIKRNNQLKIELETSNKYQEILIKQQEKQNQVFKLQLKLQKKSYEFRSYQIVANLMKP